jgi:hypothetical protein
LSGRLPKSNAGSAAVLVDELDTGGLYCSSKRRPAAVHTATMKLSRSLDEAEYLEHRDSADRTFNNLARTFVTQMEALKRYRLAANKRSPYGM